MRLLIIDGTNLIMRCASIPDFDTEDKVVDASSRLAYSACIDIKATHCVVVFDGERAASARRAMYPAYKADRTSSTEHWSETGARRFPALGFYVLRAHEWEGDDYIATLALRSEGRTDVEVAVLSADSDMLALLGRGEGLEVWQYGRKPEPRFVKRDAAYVRQRYGVEPWQLTDYKALAGEPGDNVLGPFGKHCAARARKLLTTSGYAFVETLVEAGVLTEAQANTALLAKEVLKFREVKLPAILPRDARAPTAL